jgi:hypothetical protein
MAMKKTSSGDCPLRQGARKSFWTLRIFGSMVAADRDVFWKTDLAFRFFPSGGLYRRRGIVRSGPRQSHTWGAWPGPRLRCPSVWLPHGPTPSPLRFSGSFGKILGDWLWFRPIPRIFPV